MQQLRVLDLTNFSLSTLPLPPPSLKNLHTLCLDECVLEDITSIGKLRTLEVLSLVKSNIKQLPEEIGELTRLRLLDLSYCSKLVVIPPNVISKLSLLEELYMGNSFDQWETKTSTNQGQKNTSLAELKGLSRLTNLEIQIRDAPVMPSDIFPKNLSRYKIFIGDVRNWDGEYKTTRTLKVKLKESIHLEFGVQVLLKSTEDLYLHGLKGVTSIFDELDSEGFQHLKHLHLQDSPSGIHFIINTMGGNSATAFPLLESLILDKLASLENICHGKLRAHSFSKLRSVNVKGCNKLKNIFSIQVAQCLLQLQNIEVASCEKIEVIIAEESEECANQNEGINEIKFSQLQSLSLQHLPQLKNFCSNEDKQISMALFNGKVMFPNLEDLNLQGIDIEKLWHGQLPNGTVSSIRNLTRLTVIKCPNLKYLFSSSMVKSLGKLKNLQVNFCKSIEEIIVMEGLEEEVKILFSGLSILELSYLPKLTRFCRGYQIQFPLLKKLRIEECRDLKTFASNFTNANIVECPANNLLNEDGKENCSTRESSSMLSCWRKMCGKISRKGKSVETPTTNTRDRKESQEVKLEEKQMQAALFDEKVAFPSLAELYISGINDMEKIWNNDQPAEGSFCELVSADIEKCPKLVNVFPSVLLRRFQRLENLSIVKCDNLEEIFDLQGLCSVKETHPFQLTDLDLSYLPKLKHIWNEDPLGILSFENLRTVSVSDCNAVENLFPFSVASENLEELDIQGCGEMKEIVGKKENDKTSEHPPHFVFSGLTTFILWSVPKFRSFYPGTHTLDFPRLRTLRAFDYGNAKLFGLESSKSHETHSQVQQPLFFLDKVNPKLEELLLDGSDNSLSIMWQRPEFLADFGYRLKLLELCNFVNKSNMFPFGFLQRLSNLKSLAMAYWSLNLKAIFSVNDGGGISQLRDLTINSVDGLRYIWARDCPLVFPNLRKLRVDCCNSLVGLAESSVSLPSLINLYVCNCRGLLNLMTPSTAKSLVRLQRLQLRHCDGMTEIVSNQGDDSNFEIIFEQLRNVEIHYLKNLTCFCSGNYTLSFPNLLNVQVSPCPKMKIFAPGPLSTPKLQNPQGSLNDAIKDDYMRMDALEYVSSLRLSEFPPLKERWHGQLPAKIFKNLESLEVDGCEDFSTSIPSNLLPFMPRLRRLKVRNCVSVVGILDLEGLNIDDEGHSGVLPELSELTLIHLPRLSYICNKDPLGILVLEKLRELKLHGCGDLTYIFTTSMGLSLVQLQHMEIRNCASIKEIISTGRAEEAETEMVVFPQLKQLVLDSLPSLTNIYSGSGIMEFPTLERICITNCPNYIKTFVKELELKSIEEGKEGRLGKEVSISPLLNRKVPFLNLKTLAVEWNDTIEQIEVLELIEGLELIQFPIDCVVFPSYFLQKLPSLTTLVVSNAPFEEIVLHKETDGMGALPRLRELELSKLSKLMHLSKEDSQPCHLIQNLETLRVSECDSLKILVPSSISFLCLLTLRVSKCQGLINLMTSSAAMYLLHLSTIAITECHKIKEIVLNKESEVETEVKYPKLECLILHHLPSLMSFCSGNFSLIFPLLKKVHVKECPRLKNFSQGVVTTPMLQSIYVPKPGRKYGTWLISYEEKELGDREEKYWEGDLNATIYKLFLERDEEVAESSPTNSFKQPTQAESRIPGSGKDLPSKNATVIELESEEQEIKDALIEPEISNDEGQAVVQSNLVSSFRDSHTSNDKEDSTQDQNSVTVKDIKTHMASKLLKDPQEMNNDQIVIASAIHMGSQIPASPTTAVQQTPMSISTSPIKTTSSSHSPTNFGNILVQMEQLLKPNPASSSQSASSSNIQAESCKSDGQSFETYSYSIALIKRILMKSRAEVASSTDHLMLLSCLKNLKNCPLLNPQQLEIIQVYVDNFDALVTCQPSYEQQIDRTHAMKFSIKDNERRISELMNQYEGLTSETSTLSENKKALKKELHEIKEREERIQENIEDVRDQLIRRKGKLVTQMNALQEAMNQQREAEDRTNNANDYWVNFRSLFA